MKIPRQLPLKQIRKQCQDCCFGSVKIIRFCHSIDCPLWYLRFGKYPRTIIKTNREEWEQLFNKDNFKKDGKFSSDKELNAFKL